MPTDSMVKEIETEIETEIEEEIAHVFNMHCNRLLCEESAWPCIGCVMKDFIYIIEDARNHHFKGNPYHSKKYLMDKILDYTSQNPVVTNLHAVELIEFYELNKSD
ncbi:MAG: hypothetical protein V3U54_08770 [Thermodesulfobacteriota bacterium]